jgi:hypothetical protein
MKKFSGLLVMMGFLAGLALAVEGPQEPTFSINAGVQTNFWRNTSFDLLLGTLDVRVGLWLGRSLQISPEIMYVTGHDFHFDYGYLYPGVMLNYVSNGFFAGAGVVLPVTYGSEVRTSNPAPKINIGFAKGGFMFTAYIIMWTESTWTGFYDFPNLNYIGATFGYRF